MDAAGENKIEDEDKQALAGLSSVPQQHRAKVHSYSQQLRGGEKRHRQVRKHSLDDIPSGVRAFSSNSASDDDFASYSLNPDEDSDGSLDLKPYNPLTEFVASAAPTGSGSGSVSGGSTGGSTGGGGGGGGSQGSSGGSNSAASGSRIFKVPTRAAVHPGRPPCLELRPHPLRETQVGKFLRNIACTEMQLWAGQECGIRFWKFDRIYDAGGSF